MKTVQIGQKVHSKLYGGMDGIIYEITGEQKPETIGNMSGVISFGGNARFKIVYSDHFSITPESILHNGQWVIYDEIASPEEIKNAIAKAEKALDDKKTEEQKKAGARAALKIKIKKDNPHLKTGEDFPGKSDLVIGAKNIRIELKLAFPGHKFSVVSESFSMGNAIQISWIDGPTLNDVEKITSKYQEGHFNGMEDIYEYDRENVWADVFGSAKYVSESREYSEAAKKKADEEFQDHDSIAYELDRKKWQWLAKQDFYTKSEKLIEKTVSAVNQDLPQEETRIIEPGKLEQIKIVLNEQFNGIEIYFPGKPDLEILNTLKNDGFRWHRVKACWYAKKSEKTMKTAEDIAGIHEKPEEKKEMPETIPVLKDFYPVQPEIVEHLPEDIKYLN